jgi:hypothetical protein
MILLRRIFSLVFALLLTLAQADAMYNPGAFTLGGFHRCRAHWQIARRDPGEWPGTDDRASSRAATYRKHRGRVAHGKCFARGWKAARRRQRLGMLHAGAVGGFFGGPAGLAVPALGYGVKKLGDGISQRIRSISLGKRLQIERLRPRERCYRRQTAV